MTRDEIILYICGVVLGICCLFAYNSFLSSPSYLEHYYQFAAVKSTSNVSTLPHAEHESFWKNVATWVTVTMMIPMLLGQVFMLTPFMLKLNLQIRMITGAAFLLFSVFLVPVCAAGGNVSENAAMAVIFISCILAGFSTTLLQSSLYALFGTLPTRYMSGFVLGGGFSGSVNSVLRIIITAALPNTFGGVKTGAVIFFVIGMVLMLVTIGIVLFLRSNPIVREHCTAYRIGGGAHGAEHDHEDHVEGTEWKESGAKNGSNTFDDLDKAHSGDEGRTDSTPKEEGANAAEAPAAKTEDNAKPASSIETIKKIWPFMVLLFIAMMNSLTLFPGIGLAAMKSDGAGDSTKDDGTEWAGQSLLPMVVILMFNLGDTIGRLITNFPKLWINKKYLPYVVGVRLVVTVIPLVLGVVKPKVINSNALPIIMMLVTGISNGYLIGIMMAYGSSDEKLESEAEHAAAGTCMCLSLLGGLSAGSILSIIVLSCAVNN